MMLRSPLSEMTGTAGWWCPHCHGPADVDDLGDAFPLCVRCGHRGLRWVVSEERAVRQSPPRVQEPAPDDRRIEPGRRLPRADRDLRKLCADGYLWCRGCEHVTTRDTDGACCLCGSGDLVQQEPVF